MALDYRFNGYPRQAAVRLWSVINLRRAAAKFARVFRVAGVNFIDNNDLLWASALTYTVTLSIVPILALAFSVLKGLGLTSLLQPLVQRYLALGSRGTADALLELVGNVNAATLGSVGGITLLLTVVSTLGTIEYAFNMIWQVPAGRSYLRKFTDYISVVFTVPLILVAAVALTASLYGRLINLFLSSIIVWVGFFFLFVFFPYTRVRWSAAALGSLFSAVLFQLAQWAYIHFWVGLSNYTEVYGALAAIPVLLLWIYVAWLIVLFGVEICFAVQRGTTRYEGDPHSLNFTRYAALLTLVRLAERSANLVPTVTVESLASELRVPASELTPIIDAFKKHGFVIECSSEYVSQTGLFLALDPAVIKLGDVIKRMAQDRSGDRRVADVLHYLHELEVRHLDTITLRDLRNGGDVLLSVLGKASPQGRESPDSN
jgi:membrane protein